MATPLPPADDFYKPGDTSLPTRGTLAISQRNMRNYLAELFGTDGTAATARATLGAAPAVPTGTVWLYTGVSAPAGWLLCDGSAVSRTTYGALLAVIGTVYGAGDGSTTFNLPDLRGRVAVGAGQGSGLTNRALGATGGEETHTLTVNEMPAHHHTATQGLLGSGTEVQLGSGYGRVQITTDNTGGGAAHNNMPPFTVTNYMIKT